MHSLSLRKWQHQHTFGQEQIKAGERRTLIVIAITAIMMIIEIVSGVLFGSMALLADGLHMGSHAAALSITAFAYYYTRKHARDTRFSFGTGKVNALAGYSSAIMLAFFALMMTGESINRFINPVEIIFNQAIIVAVAGLCVNGISFLILGGHHQHVAKENLDVRHTHKHSDHNLRAATLHVLADALTSFFAIIALLAAKYFNLVWMDPLMGIVGAVLVARWSRGLLKDASGVLLDKQASADMQEIIKETIERQDGNRIADLHIWSVGPGIYSAELSIITSTPKPPDYYKELLPDDLGLVHTVVEVHRYASTE